MKKSKRIAALIAAVLMTVTVFTSAVPAYAAEPVFKMGTDSYGSNIVTGYRTSVKQTEMSARAKSNNKATRIATTIITRTVDSKGNLVKPARNKDLGKDNATDSGIATVTSGSGNHFEYIYILCAATYDNNLNHCASVPFSYEF